MTHIYALIDKQTKNPFYIGKSNNPDRRFGEHIREAKRYDNRNVVKETKIRELGYQNGVEIVVIENAGDMWAERELFWIKFYLEQFNLTNLVVH